ncbi:hypothetical protein GL4_0623 [Methyloceanibacter caenitepidi]|uniref:Lipoprotein n=1 Tax=Methyloceanibacter caenitepidi TaxID=1384459 RepID=A0A0A8K012_9HYPH|nr:hypothetical protein GL4_0623 [Methyloceanibacter caenitepidi]
MRLAFAALFALSVAACATPGPNYTWHKAGASEAQGRRIITICEGRVNSLQALNPQATTAHLDAAMAGCMAEHGYSLRPA